MPVTMISGARASQGTNTILAARKVVDMSPVIHQLEDDKNLLSRLVMQMSKKPTHNASFNWLTDELSPKDDAINNAAGEAAAQTTITVDNGGYFRINDLVKVPRTGEVMLVTAISGNDLDVTRSVGATAAADMVDNEPLLILGPAYNEGATLEAARSTTEVNNTNYTQIFRHAWHLTGTEDAMGKAGGLYGGDDETVQRTKKLIEHSRDINLSAYWGEASSSSARRTTGGVYEFIPTANRDSVAALTEAEFNDGLRGAFRYGSAKKIMFASRKVAGIVNEFMQNVQRVEPGDSKFGVRMVDYISPHGDLNIVTDHAIEGTEYNKYAFVLDITKCAFRFLKGRDTQLLLDRQGVDEDAKKEEYLTEGGFEWGEGRTHYVFNGVTS